MTDLQIRRIQFEFDSSVPFQWNRANPDFGLMANAIGVLAIAFEKYIVAVTRQAIPLLTDPALAEEAEAFLRQEAQHARAHRLHINALIEQHPGLRATLDEAVADYDRLREREPLEYHVAYIAALEATFTPLFKMMLDNRQSLFTNGDDRVASLFAWHFVEEIEHRSSALLIYHGLIDDPRYRTRVARRVFAHAVSVYAGIIEGFERHVPLADRLVDTRRMLPRSIWLREVSARLPLLRRRLTADQYPTAFQQVPIRQLCTTLVRLLLSQAPRHRPVNEPLPAWADTWFDAYGKGTDMTRFEGTPLGSGR
ncbi:metal-dependent hydrolase [Actinomadura craniellae]|uniref:Metal-dependent hydrolase n=1 Tax=Actinomadura craniellae TaxID=2231787 RepID=A0A365H0R1_9ACTN|nr:metal-dependent hydrolase [Actinomadura craniellae]RAY12670.1 metal-dependent hydrolase [Actinomadura craniellae]